MTDGVKQNGSCLRTVGEEVEGIEELEEQYMPSGCRTESSKQIRTCRRTRVGTCHLMHLAFI